jgi:hypothetical protein
MLEARAEESNSLSLPGLSVWTGHALLTVKPAFLRASTNVDHPKVAIAKFSEKIF